MCDIQREALALIALTKSEDPQGTTCLCTRLFIQTKENNTKSSCTNELIAIEEDNLQKEEEYSENECGILCVQRITQKDTETETLSCYCSASHTDTLSTDEHDSLRDYQDHKVAAPSTADSLRTTAHGSIQPSDSGADLTECHKQDVETDWHKFWSINGERLIWESWISRYSEYINPDYIQQDVDSGASVLSGCSDKQKKTEKFTFDEKDVQNLASDQSRNLESTSKHHHFQLNRTLSGSDEKLFTEVSEGWNPLSPLSVDCEQEQERLLSSRCGSHASSSLHTIDSMTNVTRMTVSSIDLSHSTTSSDSFSSVSSVQSSISSEQSEEDYQNQWNFLWKQHYEEEYLQQYNKFLLSRLGSSLSKPYQKTRKIPNTASHLISSSSADSHLGNALCDIMSHLRVSESKDSEPDEVTSYQTEMPEDDVQQMMAMGLPVAFGDAKTKRSNESKTSEKIIRNDSFDSGRNRVKAAFELMGIEFKEIDGCQMTGQVNYKMKHIRLQNRRLKLSRTSQKPKHIHFDDDGNALASEDSQPLIHGLLSDSSENSENEEDQNVDSIQNSVKLSTAEAPKPIQKKKRKKKIAYPPAIKENSKLRKYWHRRFSLFSRFDEGIKLDEESWYSVTPEQVAKHAAERCRCDIIIDGFCGAGGNSIQFAFTCTKVIAIDIDPKKIEIAQNNAEVYGVSHKIEFIVGDFLQLAETLKADTVFLSPPWGGPTYLHQTTYDLETMLQPVPLSVLLSKARMVSKNVAVFLPKNSNSYALIREAGVGRRVEIEQDFLNNKQIAITAYYEDLIK